MSVLITLMTVTNVPTVPTPMAVLSATADQDYKEMGEFVMVIINILKQLNNACLQVSTHMLSKKHDYFWPADQP